MHVELDHQFISPVFEDNSYEDRDVSILKEAAIVALVAHLYYRLW